MGAISIKKKDYGTGIPRHEIEALARCLLPEIQKFFESEEGKKEFVEWKRQQTENQKEKQAIKN
ncbi:MAG TPA: hypothetical protein DDZ89_12715 [Clostridiales bacterium]|nr:hypothetical protein [Clostridiales bacterium]